MAITVTQSPLYPTTAAPVRLKFAATGGGNYVRVWCTNAPNESAIREELLSERKTRVQIHEGDVSSTADLSAPFDFRPDKGGKYVLTAQEYTRGASVYGGGYSGDPNGFSSETKVGGETSITIVVGDRHTMRLGTGPDTATLVVWIWESTIRATSFDLHGETTPDIIDASSPKAATAVVDATIRTAIAALADQLVTTVLGSLSTVVSNIITKFNLHRVEAGKHASDDTDNVVSGSFASPGSPSGLVKAPAEVMRKLDQHMRNDDGSGTGTGGGSYHSAADWTNMLIASAPGDIAAAMVAIADLWRAYEAHRVSAVHSASDTTNTLTALPALLNIHKLFLDIIRQTAPTAPDNANAGSVLLIHGAGSKIG